MHRIAIVGCGSRGIECFGKLLKAREDVELVALHDLNPVRLQAASEYLDTGARVYTSLDGMLAAEKPEAVVITTPDYLHCEHSLACLRANAHVLVDKPLATTVADCRGIIEAAEAARRIVMVGFNLRCHPVLKRLKEIIDSGMLGKLFLIENREFYNGGRTYMSRWNRLREKSGGLWIHKGSHDFDIFNWLLDFPRPLRVTATAGNNVFTPDKLPFPVKPGIPPGPGCGQCAYADICPDVHCFRGGHLDEMWGQDARGADNYAKDLCMYLSDKDVHDNGIALVEYEGGIRASHLECFACAFDDRMYTLVGDRGTAEVSLTQRRIVIRPRWHVGETIEYSIPEPEGGHGGADPGLVDKFIATLDGTASDPSTAAQALWSTAIGQAAELAWREKRSINVGEIVPAL